MRWASTLLVPCAMLANGPQWTMAGAPSVVWTRLGSSASCSSTIIGPTASRSEARTGCPVPVNPTTMSPNRRAQVGAAGGQREDGHDLGGRRDDEPGFPRRAVAAPAEANRNLPQARGRSCPSRAATARPRVSRPSSLPKCRWTSTSAASRLCAEVMAWKSPLKCRLILSSGASDARAPASRAALLPEDRPERRLAQRRDGGQPATDEALGEPDGRDRLALATGGRCDGGDQHELPARLLEAIEQLETDLGGEPPVGLQQFVRNAQAFGDLADGKHNRRILVRVARKPVTGA